MLLSALISPPPAAEGAEGAAVAGDELGVGAVTAGDEMATAGAEENKFR